VLQARFLPPRGQREVRDLTRSRTTLVQERAREVNRVQGGWVVYLSPADKYHRLTRRLSKEQKVL